MILDYMFTYGGPELFMALVVLVITPIVYRLFLRRLRLSARLMIVLAIWLAGSLIAYTDVYLIAREARKLCGTKAGMHIYERVVSDGVLGLRDIRLWRKYNVPYVEYSSSGKRWRYREELKDGEVIKAEIDDFRSPYAFESEMTPLSMPIVKNVERITARRTGTVLGEATAYSFYPGWLDRRLLGALGFAWTPPRCDGSYAPEPGRRTLYPRDLISSVFD